MRLTSALVCGLIGTSCQITFSDELVYICANDFECGGGGYACVSGVCCRATGPELCGDGKDNDCDGRVDGDCEETSFTAPQREAECLCDGGRAESEEGVSCGDGLDNDCDGLTDCFEPGCAAQSCSPDGGVACVCVGTRKAERSCTNSSDDDGDSLADCADPDCFGDSCEADGGLGCLCAGGSKTEAHCGDGLDNDGDGLRDCADEVDCPAGSSCTKLSNGQAGFCQAASKACN